MATVPSSRGWFASPIIGLVFVAVAMVGVGGLGRITPTGFFPEDDQGAFFVIVQSPDGASIARTTDVVQADRGRC